MSLSDSDDPMAPRERSVRLISLDECILYFVVFAFCMNEEVRQCYFVSSDNKCMSTWNVYGSD